MSEAKPGSLDRPLLSRDMLAVLVAQFPSMLADNAILIAGIAIVKSQGLANFVPLLQESFVVPFILLAPFVGQLTDGFPKGRVMQVANLLKLAGAIAMWAGVNPLLAYGLIGVGAAAYSPAKYGILSQMVSPSSLVRANSMMEGSSIVAILLGLLLGSWLADHSMQLAFAGVMAAYALSAVVNLFIPDLPAVKAGVSFHPWTLCKQFISSLAFLFKNPDSRFSMLGSSAFWGSGSTLRMLLFAWVPAALLIADNQTPANLMGAVSIGIVLGAVGAGLWVSLENVNRALFGGLLLGPAVLVLAFVHTFSLAIVLMIVIGICGGWFVVPLNALLQKCGHETIGAGNALAVQNFSENIAMLVFVGGYSLAMSIGISVTKIVIGFGAVLMCAIFAIAAIRMRAARK